MAKTTNNTIIFPRRLDSKAIGYVSEKIKILVTSSSRQNMEVYLDVGELRFIEPLAMTVLFDQISYLKTYGFKVYITKCALDGNLSAAIRYMDDSEFFLQISGRRLSLESNCRETTLPICKLPINKTLMWLENKSMQWLADRLGTSRDNLAEIKICLEEIFNNTKDHSGVKDSTAFIQHFPKKREIKICVSDIGIGLVSKIQKSHPSFTPFDCIIHAIKEGFTTQSTHRNAGMGLFTLACTVCNNGGRFILRTGEITATVSRGDGGTPAISIEDCQPIIDGTAFEITLYQDKLSLLQATTEDFSWD